jgi:malate dehydrogenase
MERADLLAANAGIFGPQGRAIAEHAAADVRVTVVGNPANTNALIAAASAEGLPAARFTALTRLDENRARAQVAAALDAPVSSIRRVPIWGNHSATQFPDVSHATVDGRPVVDALAERVGDVRGWLERTFIPRVAKRGAEIIEVRGSSSVASAANAAIEHARDWVQGTDDWTSAGVVSRGEYGVPEGLVSSFPVRSVGGEWRVVEGIELDDWARARVEVSVEELVEEREAVRALGVL